MKRRPGLQGLQNHQAERGQFKALGEDVAKQQLQRTQEQFVTFRKSLEEFAVKHRKQIKQDPLFRAQFHKMCAHTGVDPLASNKGVWVQFLGLGDYYYELGVQIIEVCMSTRQYNGGLIDLTSLTTAVQKRRGGATEAISEDDLNHAIKQLKVLDPGFRIMQVGDKQIVSSVPIELNIDHNTVLELAQMEGYVTLHGMQTILGWERNRIGKNLESLLKEQVAMIDDGAPDGIRRYWFPCVSREA